MTRTTYFFRASTAMVAVMVALTAMLLVQEPAKAGLVIDDGVCLGCAPPPPGGWCGLIGCAPPPPPPGPSIDTTAPSAPLIASPAEGSTVNVDSFIVSGTAEANSTVKLFEGIDLMGTATADTSGQWSIHLTGVSDGPHTYKATATDAADNVSADSEARSVRVDATAPSAPIVTSPASNSFDTDGSFTVTGTAEANSTVELVEGLTSRGAARANASGQWSITLSGVPDGSHSYTAIATDDADNASAESEARTVIVDATMPTVSTVVPAENATGVAPGANVSALFSEAMRASSISARTFKLYKKGSTTALAATFTYDATTKRAVLNPSTNLQRRATYKAVVSTGVRDLAGNQLGQQKAWFFTVRS